jgi:hypothetical protein
MVCLLWGPCLADSLKWSSALSVALALVFVVITVAVALWKLVAGEIEWPRLTPDVHDATSFWHLFTVVPVMVTAYICHHNGLFSLACSLPLVLFQLHLDYNYHLSCTCNFLCYNKGSES